MTSSQDSPSTITAIQKQKRRLRADIYLDGVYAFTLSLDLVVERRLVVGEELSPETRRDLEVEDQRRGAIESALRSLAIMPRSEKELRDRLKRRGYPRPAVDAAVTRMQELGYLDDAVFARFFVEARQASTPRSRRALAFELGRKGIDRELVSETIATLSDAEAAYDAAQRRLRSLRNLERQDFNRRLGSFLASRGFSYSIARATTDRCWRELAED